MKLRLQIMLMILFVVVFTGLLIFLSQNGNLAVLDPKGIIADKERHLIIFASLLGLLVVVPVFVMLFTIAWKYRAGNTKAIYAPEWDGSRRLETLWWGIPILIIVVLGFVTVKATHELDPYRPIASNVPPVTVQVVALQWKWLFIYPDQKVASVNALYLPEKTPINFTITGDAPMNSFWIPSLGGQVYAMSGMSTQLHLMADQSGDYNGSSANVSGHGFAAMKFVAHVTPKTEFDSWVSATQHTANGLGWDAYTQLAQPSTDNPVASYKLQQADLYDKIIMKYMTPSAPDTAMSHDTMPGMDMAR
jgi:cytochrome o ubiquinol oxidase subunit 2